MQDGIRWDRATIRAVLCAAVVLSAVPPAVGARAVLGDGQLMVGLLAVAALCVAVGVGLRPGSRGGWWSVGVAAVAVVASCAVALALPFASAAWVPFLAVWTVAVCGLRLVPAAALSAAPVAAIAWRSWREAGDPATVALNVAVAIAVFTISWTRTRQREARELAEAQRLVIELERARVDAHERRRETAAQLHDVLAHTLSGLMITLHGATAAARTSQGPADLLQRLDAATALARDGLVEARRAVETLHAETRESADPGDGDLAGWLDQALDRLRTGAAVDVTVAGSVAELPPQWSDLARSVLMEALTNTIRHAAGSPVRIVFTGPPHPGVSVLSVGDPERFTERHHPSGGHGLDGLAERAARLGATLHHGSSDDGFVVRLETAPMPASA